MVFLETMMEKMGFAREWIRWVMTCVSTLSYTILLNGTTHGFIKPERGLQQGDPLSLPSSLSCVLKLL